MTDFADVDRNTRERIEQGGRVSAVDYLRMMRLRNAAVADFVSALSDRDIIPFPTTRIPAPLISLVSTGPAFHRAKRFKAAYGPQRT